ncbi:hypothetical protein [Edaphobacter aggregans]|uniref:hypothetical protein n=1 Tax=Edaphobacter aggregans TaxID=570835 RepID=UPI0005577F22|nr:hypothetical protein [Edaphobacter aggregans]
MPQIVFEFAAEAVEHLFRLIQAVIVPVQKVRVMACSDRDSLLYQDFSGAPDDLLSQLKDGVACSIVMFSTGEIRYGLITCPHFNGQNLSRWMGTIEISSLDWQTIWEQILASPNLELACAAVDEGIELTDETIAQDSFPWSDPSLLAGAIRSVDGTWIYAPRGA